MGTHPAITSGTDEPLDPELELLDVIALAHGRHPGQGVTATQTRQAMLRTWGIAAGKARAESELRTFIASFPNRHSAADAMGCGSAALRRLENFYSQLSPRLLALDKDTEEWLRVIPGELPKAIRSAEVRVKAVKDIEVVIAEIAAHEFAGIERGVVEELVLPGLSQVVGALRLDEGAITAWQQRRFAMAEGMGSTSKGKRILEYGAQTGSVLAGIEAAFALVRGLMS